MDKDLLLPLLKSPEARLKLKAEKCRRDFNYFISQFWSIACPHAQFICEMPQRALICTMQALGTGKLGRLPNTVINCPPRSTKSLICTSLGPAWMLARDSTLAFLVASHTIEQARNSHASFMAIIESPLYRSLFPHIKVDPRNDNKDDTIFLSGGRRTGTAVGCNFTGLHYDLHIYDDLVATNKALNQEAIDKANTFVADTLSSRWRDNTKKSILVVQQRIAPTDISSRYIGKPGVRHLNLPAHATDKPSKLVAEDGTVIFEDTRAPGELLAPIQLPQSVMDDKISIDNMSSMAFEAQYEQNPTNPKGNIIQKEWFSARHSPYPAPGISKTPTDFYKISLIIDCTFKKTLKADRVCGLVVGSHRDGNLYCLDAFWAQMSFTETVKNVKDIAQLFRLDEVQIEEAANGAAVIDQLKVDLPSLVVNPILAKESKEARVWAAESFIKAKKFILPECFRSTNFTVNDFIDEVCAFGGPVAHDDATDALSWSVIQLHNNDSSSRFENYMRNR